MKHKGAGRWTDKDMCTYHRKVGFGLFGSVFQEETLDRGLIHKEGQEKERPAVMWWCERDRTPPSSSASPMTYNLLKTQVRLTVSSLRSDDTQVPSAAANQRSCEAVGLTHTQSLRKSSFQKSPSGLYGQTGLSADLR